MEELRQLEALYSRNIKPSIAGTCAPNNRMHLYIHMAQTNKRMQKILGIKLVTCKLRCLCQHLYISLDEMVYFQKGETLGNMAVI